MTSPSPSTVPQAASVLVLLVLLVHAWILGPAPSALGQEVRDGLGIRLLEVPADRSEDPRARSYVIDHVAPGTVIERRFEVSNGSDEESLVSLYAARAEIDADAFRPAPGREQNELSGWITVDPTSVVMQPRGRITATLRIEVPSDASAGERYAVVLAEQGPPDTVPSGSVGLSRRVGLRIYLSVGEGAEPATDFEISSLTALTDGEGTRVVRASVANTGGRALDLVGQLSLTDGPGGLSAGPFGVSSSATLAPGATVELDVRLDAEVPAGPWEVDLRLESGTLVRRAHATITFPDQPGEVAAPQPNEAAGGRVTTQRIVLGVLIGTALVGGGIAAAMRLRGLRGPQPGGPPARPSAPPPARPSVPPPAWSVPRPPQAEGSRAVPNVPPPPSAAG